jgi:hypothetical protein
MTGTQTVEFGRGFTDVPQPMTLQGQTGWFSVPRQWYARPFEGGSNQWEVSPYPNFAQPVYLACLGDDLQTMVFQDLIQEKITGISP